MGGHLDHPTYKDVCTDRTGHAEVVQVEYDPADRVGLRDLLNVFWENHDPTQLNRQGPDVGKQYRSAIFFHTPEQEAAARASKQALEASGRFSRPIATEIVAGPYVLARRGLSPAVPGEARAHSVSPVVAASLTCDCGAPHTLLAVTRRDFAQENLYSRRLCSRWRDTPTTITAKEDAAVCRPPAN